MKVSAILLFLSLWLIHIRTSYGEYRLRRMPYQPGRPQPPQQISPQFAKKWNMHQRQASQRPQRPPPNYYKKPIGPPPPQRIAAIPMRIAPTKVKQVNWNQNIYRPPVQEKPFLSSPTVNVAEFDFHVQTNQIPNHSNLVKQVDEKGPIHTIPAPNLSPADKPAHIEEVKPVQQTIVDVQKAQQYQVTESQEQPKKMYRQELYFPDKNLKQQEIYYPEKAKQQDIYYSDKNINHPEEQKTQEILVTSQEQQDIYKLLQSFPQQLDGYQFPIVSQTQLQPQIQQQLQAQLQPQLQQQLQSQLQQLPAYLTHPQFFRQDSPYVAQIQQKDFNNPEFLSFNYEEPTQKPPQNAEHREIQVVSGYPSEVQSEFVQSFYENREDPVANNNVEPNVEANQGYINQQYENVPELKEELISGTYYSSLPNKHAAETLASLQAAGKQNSNIMQINNQPKKEVNVHHKNSMTIYVPDEYEEEKNNNGNSRGNFYKHISQDKQGEYDESSTNNYEGEATNGEIETFGSRIKPKKY